MGIFAASVLLAVTLALAQMQPKGETTHNFVQAAAQRGGLVWVLHAVVKTFQGIMKYFVLEVCSNDCRTF